MLDSGGCDEGIGGSDRKDPTQPARPLGDRPIHWDLAKRGQQSLDAALIGGSTGIQLAAGDHGIGRAVEIELQSVSASQMIDQDVRVDQDLSHAPTHRG